MWKIILVFSLWRQVYNVCGWENKIQKHRKKTIIKAKMKTSSFSENFPLTRFFFSLSLTILSFITHITRWNHRASDTIDEAEESIIQNIFFLFMKTTIFHRCYHIKEDENFSFHFSMWLIPYFCKYFIFCKTAPEQGTKRRWRRKKTLFLVFHFHSLEMEEEKNVSLFNSWEKSYHEKRIFFSGVWRELCTGYVTRVFFLVATGRRRRLRKVWE